MASAPPTTRAAAAPTTTAAEEAADAAAITTMRFDAVMQTTGKLSRMLETLIVKSNHQQKLLNNMCDQAAATASAMEAVTLEAATAMATIAQHHRIQVENYRKAARSYDAEQPLPSSRPSSVPPPPTPTAFKTTPPHLKIIVAACQLDKGIGFRGSIPWHIPEDTAHFKEITTTTTDPKRRNGIIMGRKTWDSIPQQYRPLSHRLNIVLSRRMPWPTNSLGTSAVLCRTLTEAVDVCTSAGCESIFIAGGAELYKEVMTTYRGPLTLYLTTVLTSFTCDVFIPDPVEYSFYRVVPRHKNLLKSNKLHKKVYYRFEVWHKVMTAEEEAAADEEEERRPGYTDDEEEVKEKWDREEVKEKWDQEDKERDECEAVPNNDFHWPR